MPGSFVRTIAALAIAACALAPSTASAQSFALDPPSASLAVIPATGGDVLNTAGAPVPGPLAPPVVGESAATLHLLPGDVVDAYSLGDDAGFGATLYFSVSRASLSAAAPFTPNVFSEATGVPPGIQPDASADIFATLDPTCGIFPPQHTQVLDGNGAAPLAPFTCYGGFGIGATEFVAAPPPPFGDQLADFDWSTAGRGYLLCNLLSLAPGSPSLTPAINPFMPAGAEPGDILVSCPGPPGFLGVAFGAAALGLVSGGPGCAPPACDDIDALAFGGGVSFSIAPGSPSLALFGLSAADVLGPGGGPPAVLIPAAGIGLLAADDVKGLESVFNPCPVAPFSPPDPDGDGVAAACPDNCPGAFNPGLEDTDADAVGDVCDACTDTDGDAVGNPGFPANLCPLDLCPTVVGPNGDADADGRGDICDNCIAAANADQLDGDFDGIGDACDACTDLDGDTFGDPGFPLNTCATDNCPFVPNAGQADGDGDGVGDACDNCALSANAGQQDVDLDGSGDVCDNCPQDSNVGQADGDGDSIGDACDICNGGVSMTRAQLQYKKLGTPGGESFKMKGTLAFPGFLPSPPLDVSGNGMRIQVVDLGANGGVILDHFIPGGLVGTHCQPNDGWKQNPTLTSESYLNKSNELPPGCVSGSALGIGRAKAKDKTAAFEGVQFGVAAKGGTYGPLVGPFRYTIVLGGTAEQNAGQCGDQVFNAMDCALNGTTLRCKQP